MTGVWAARHGQLAAGLHEFVVFGIKQAWACLFGGLMVALLIGTHLWYPANAPIARYDALTIAAVIIQIALLWLKLETWDEAKVILMFHVAGTGMEVFKTAVGSWIYPEASLLRIGGVPLFTGFMYASVGSYIARAWREFDLRFSHHPPLVVTALLSLGIYANFFLHHYWWDLRYALMVLIAMAFRRCWIHFRIDRVHRRMPFLLGFTLVALFIWLAENIGTFTRTWLYPNQLQSWEMVSIAKLGAWFLLTIMSYVMVTLVNPPQPVEGA
ncbi:hypothetical protein AC240_05150 [Ralstonia sp. MD27]|nr:hypothetical protein AC240_05150 [Ralstonia sp. MD27]